MFFRFEVRGEKLLLYKRRGESFEHVLMKALLYGLASARFASLEIERNLGGRYTPDVVAVDGDGRVAFWGECGDVSMRKVAWLAKHSGAGELAFAKIGAGAAIAAEMRKHIDARYRPDGRITLYSFVPDIRARVEARNLRVETVPASWYRRIGL